MTQVDVRSPDGETAGSIDLPEDVFDVPANLALMHQVVVAQLAAARAGTHSTKNRGEVRGGGAKPYRQKGTGRARQGSTRAPQFAGGGVVHGPTPRDYSQRTPKKMKAAALRAALSDRARDGRIHVVSAFTETDVPSTRDALGILDTLLAETVRSRRVLVVLPPDDVTSWKSLRNVKSVHLLDSGQLNTYDVLVSDDVIFTEQALQEFLSVQATRRSRRGTGPDLSTSVVSGGIPSMVPAEGDGDVTVTLGKPSAADTAAKPMPEPDPVDEQQADRAATSQADVDEEGEQ